MLRFVLLLVLSIIISRMIWRIVSSFMDGMTGRPRGSRSPQRAVQMVRDPVCGTFVLPDRAVTLSVGGAQVFFCSSSCRDEYRARPSTHSAGAGSPRATSRGERANGRTA